MNSERRLRRLGSIEARDLSHQIERRKQVLIVEDHPVFADGLAALLNHDPALHVCGTATSVAQAWKAVVRQRPDLLIVDIGLPDKSGFELIGKVAARKQRIPILVVSAGDETVQATRALRAGAAGYVMKHEGPARLLEAVHEVLENKTSVSSAVAEQIIRSVQRGGKSAAPIELLSARELEVLSLLGDGQNSLGIANQLGLSRKTIEAYRQSIQQKLGVPDAHALIHYAVRWRMGGGGVPAGG